MRVNKKQLSIGVIALGTILTGGLISGTTPYASEKVTSLVYNLSEECIVRKEEKKLIMIDPGHGGYDAGAVNPITGDREAQYNMEIALKVKHKLELEGYQVVLTRYYHREFYEIYERVNMGNTGDHVFFLSIHNNATKSHKGTGTETFYNGYGNAKDIAVKMSQNIANNINSINRGAKETPYFNYNIKKPSVLVECEFIDNAEGLDKIKNKQEEIAKGIVDGLLEYL